MQLNPQTKVTMLPPEFVQVINGVVQSAPDVDKGVIINFRDPHYSADTGGHHPVEIHVDSHGEMLCLTDFAYFGSPPFIELGIELDFSFEHDYFRQFDSMYDLDCGRSLLGLYTRNFAAYYNSGVYLVEVSAL